MAEVIGRDQRNATVLPHGPKPPWLKITLREGENFRQIRELMRSQSLHTVCEEARCPNIHECWERRSATYMILGDVCTRACAFCAVKSGRPEGLDIAEPLRLAQTVRNLGLRYCVITSVDRDDLHDGGAEVFAQCIRLVHRMSPECRVEVLTPDFQGNLAAVRTVIEARPEVFNHNIETIPAFYRRVRPKSIYEQSLAILRFAKQVDPRVRTKSGFMVGLGEEREDLHELLRDLRRHEVDIITIGQYLRPTLKHHPVIRYYHPDEFQELKTFALGLGFAHVESGPLVRSSYHADEHFAGAQASA
ncbi:MAG: lipoyl synthase [Candidatus Dormibacteria bacterium]